MKLEMEIIIYDPNTLAVMIESREQPQHGAGGIYCILQNANITGMGVLANMQIAKAVQRVTPQHCAIFSKFRNRWNGALFRHDVISGRMDRAAKKRGRRQCCDPGLA